MQPETIFDLKMRAHELIDDLVMSGLPKARVYKKLKFFLRVRNGEEHVGSMASMSQVKKAIGVLTFLKKMRGVSKNIVIESNRLRSGHKSCARI